MRRKDPVDREQMQSDRAMKTLSKAKHSRERHTYLSQISSCQASPADTPNAPSAA